MALLIRRFSESVTQSGNGSLKSDSSGEKEW